MDDKQFDKIMNEYVGLHKQNKDKILRQLKTEEKKSKVGKTYLPKWAWPLGTCVLIVAVCLSVFLPIYLNKEDDIGAPAEPFEQNNPAEPTKPDIIYQATGDFMPKEIESLEELEAELGYRLPSISMECNMGIFHGKLIYKDKPEDIIGSYIDFYVFDEVLDSITVKIFTEDKKEHYKSLKSTNAKLEYNGMEISYLKTDMNQERFFCFATFQIDNLVYYIDIEAIGEIDLNAIMEALILP